MTAAPWLGKTLRTAQTYFPRANDLKYVVQRSVRRVGRRPFEGDFHAVRDLGLSSDALILDVGANRGQSVDALHLTAPGRWVVSFEPNPLMARQLRRRYRTADRWALHEVALSDQVGQLQLYIPSYRGYTFDGLGSLERGEAEDWLESRVHRFDRKKLEMHRYLVPTRTLDSFGYSPELIKMDVQGHELAVLQGAVHTLGSSRPNLLIESPSSQLVDFLAQYDYEPFSWTGTRLAPGVSETVGTFFRPGARAGGLSGATS